MVVECGIKKPVLLLATVCEISPHSGVRGDHLGEEFWDPTYFHHLVCLQSGNCCQEYLRWFIQPAGALKNALADCLAEIILHHASKVSRRFANHHITQSNVRFFGGHTAADTNHQSEPYCWEGEPH